MLCLALVAASVGCGGSSHRATTPPATAPAPRPTASARSATPLSLIDSVCRTVRAGAPAPLRSPVTVANVRRHAGAALPAARRTFVSLGRLTTQPAQARAMGPLVARYRLLTGLYTAAAGSTFKPTNLTAVARSISLAEQQAGAAARAAGVPLCAPYGPGVASATR